MMMKWLSLVLLLSVSVSHAAVELQNSAEIRKSFGLDQYPPSKRLSSIKVAVVDNGFSGVDQDAKYLPASTKLVTQYDAEFIKKFNLGDPTYHLPQAQTEHGRIMAQLLLAMTGAKENGPQLYLLNANGMTNFRRAVRYAIEEKVDLILYSQNRECCGDFDGKGFLNDIVNSATQAGILWINAAGNYGGQVFNGPYNTSSLLRIKSHLDENTAQIILNWNSTGPEEESGTDKDLDLYLLDEEGKEVAKSELKQVLAKKDLGDGESFLARERIKFTFSKNTKGHYRIVVKTKSGQFDFRDRIRLTVIPEKANVFDPEKKRFVNAVEFVDATKGGEIMVPADNPNVITVGDLQSYSSMGPTADGRTKPEIILENSVASFSDGQTSEGTSNAAAYFAGIVTVLKSYRKNLDRATLLSFPKKSIDTPQPVSLSEFASLHGAVLAFIEQETGESPLLAGRYSDGRYVLGIRQIPRDVLPTCEESQTEKRTTTFYLAYLKTRGQQRLSCFPQTADTEFPWQTYRQWNRTAFVEIRQVYMGGSPRAPRQGIWKTPSLW